MSALAWAVGAALAAALPAVAQQLDDAQVQLLTSVVANAAAADLRFDVLTQEDLRRTLELEGERRALGCETAGGAVGSDNCMAEIAAALGAQLVLHAEAGALGDELLLALNLYDSQTGSSGGRDIVRGPDPKALADGSEVAVRALLKKWGDAHPAQAGQTRVKVLVLDVKRRGPGPPGARGAGAGSEMDPLTAPYLLVGAGAAVLIGGGALLAGFLLDRMAVDSRERANDPKTEQTAVPRLNEQANVLGPIAIVLYAAGAIGVAGAAALIAAHFVVGE